MHRPSSIFDDQEGAKLVIQSKEDYIYYLREDKKALGRTSLSFIELIGRLVFPDWILDFQRLLRKLEYLTNLNGQGFIHRIVYLYYWSKFRRLSVKLGFSIPLNVFGPGLSIVHYGTIVVNCNARIGANCRIHVDTNIGASGGTDKAPCIGDNVYIAPGVKVFGDIQIPSNTALGANAVVNRSFKEEGMLIAGVPAKVIGKVDIKQLIRHI